MTRSIGVGDVTGIVGILPTPSLPGAGAPTATDTVNLHETERMTDLIVAAGVDVIVTNGTFGEAATLTADELFAFNDVVIQTVAGRVPVFCGASTSNTRDTISRARTLLGLGADGLFVGRPLWLPLDQGQIVDFYRAVAGVLPEAPIILYDNPGVFKGAISPEAYEELSRIDQIVASKHYGVRDGDGSYEEIIGRVQGRLRLLPTLDSWLPSRDRCGTEVSAAWSGDVASGPEVQVALARAIRSDDRTLAEQAHSDLVWATETLFPGGDQSEFMAYSIQIDRAEFEAAGYITPGPARHPYTSAPAAYLEGGAEVGRRFARLREKYALGAQIGVGQ